MALSDIDRTLLNRCLANKPRAWDDFADRFLGLVVHVIGHTAQARSMRLSTEDTEDLTAEVFLAILKDDYAVLRRFRAESSLATYLTVVARRVVVQYLLKNVATRMRRVADSAEMAPADLQPPSENRISNLEEVERMMDDLNTSEAEIVRLFHLEGKSYREISSDIGVAENSIGPTLSRARAKMRQMRADSQLG